MLQLLFNIVLAKHLKKVMIGVPVHTNFQNVKFITFLELQVFCFILRMSSLLFFNIQDLLQHCSCQFSSSD
jgi:hypothetical protein